MCAVSVLRRFGCVSCRWAAYLRMCALACVCSFVSFLPPYVRAPSIPYRFWRLPRSGGAGGSSPWWSRRCGRFCCLGVVSPPLAFPPARIRSSWRCRRSREVTARWFQDLYAPKAPADGHPSIRRKELRPADDWRCGNESPPPLHRIVLCSSCRIRRPRVLTATTRYRPLQSPSNDKGRSNPLFALSTTSSPAKRIHCLCHHAPSSPPRIRCCRHRVGAKLYIFSSNDNASNAPPSPPEARTYIVILTCTILIHGMYFQSGISKTDQHGGLF